MGRQKTHSTSKRYSKILDWLSGHKILLSLSLIIILVISLIIWTFTSANPIVISGGSTSVYPIMQDLTQVYLHDEKGKTNILYNAIGSAAALTFVQNKVYTFGFLSEEISPEQGRNLLSNNIKSFAFAADYILMVYHLPTNSELNPNDVNHVYYDKSTKSYHLKFDSLEINGTSIGEGVKEVRALYSGAKWNAVFPNAFIKGGDESPVSFTRENGSGTRLFFESKVIHTKRYKFNQTAASSGAMFDGLSSIPSSIGYVSFDYLKKLVVNPQLGVFAIQNDQLQQPELPYVYVNNQYDFNKSYSLTRPFMGVINTKAKDYLKSIKFIAWMLAPYDPNTSLNPRQTAYWYLRDGELPLMENDSYYQLNKDAKNYGNIYDDVKKYFDEVPGKVNNYNIGET